MVGLVSEYVGVRIAGKPFLPLGTFQKFQPSNQQGVINVCTRGPQRPFPGVVKPDVGGVPVHGPRDEKGLLEYLFAWGENYFFVLHLRSG